MLIPESSVCEGEEEEVVDRRRDVEEAEVAVVATFPCAARSFSSMMIRRSQSGEFNEQHCPVRVHLPQVGLCSSHCPGLVISLCKVRIHVGSTPVGGKDAKKTKCIRSTHLGPVLLTLDTAVSALFVEASLRRRWHCWVGMCGPRSKLNIATIGV